MTKIHGVHSKKNTVCGDRDNVIKQCQWSLVRHRKEHGCNQRIGKDGSLSLVQCPKKAIITG